jgi:primosomal protein N' (replication factor Y)
MPVYLEVAVNVPQVTGVYTYHLPPELEGNLAVGHLVLVPFGGQTVQGVVFRFVDQPGVPETRPVLELVDPEAVLTESQIRLAEQMAHDCLAPLAACLGTMLPPGLEQKADLLYTPAGRQPDDLTTVQSRLLKLLYRRGPLSGSQIDRAMPRVNWRASARALKSRGALTTRPLLPDPRVRPKVVRTARLAVPAEAARAALPELGKTGSKALGRRQAMLSFLIEATGPVEAAWVYAETGGNSSDLRYLSERGLVTLGERQRWRDPLGETDFQPYGPPTLTQDQRSVWEKVRDLLEASASGEPTQPILLHGVTGSGKTEIYLQAVQHTLSLGRQTIVLVPEIALTPQTVRRFAGRFPDQVGLVHSGLSPGERYDTWRRARAGQVGLVVGPRSALFTPFARLGLIVVDESHDDSYYQGEIQPHYHAREEALAYARLIGAVCLMGSATPDIPTMYRARRGEIVYLHLPERILAHRQAVQAQMERLAGGCSPDRRSAGSPDRRSHQDRGTLSGLQARSGLQGGELRSRFKPLEGDAEALELPPVAIIDMRLELQSGNRSIFSRPLQQALKEVLEQGLQAILFLNRRGSATYVFCRDCGYTLRCPRCETPLTYHEAEGLLRCHYCGYQRKNPQTCPQCHSSRIRHYGTGTQKVEAEVQALFPEARTLRWDYETTRRKGAHEAILSRFIAQGADVLIGTQMLAKGLDLPLVTLVGMVLADVGLSLPDYRAGERAFQVLTQVAGRSGRSPLGGQVILQTFQPEHYVIQAASRHDYEAFYIEELEYRRRLGYPPFAQLARLEYRHHDAGKAETAAQGLAERLRGWLEEEGRRTTRLIGPAPCFFGRLGGQYRWQIAICGPDPASLLRGRPLGDWRVEVNPPSLL